MNVFGEIEVLELALDEYGLVSTLEKWTDSMISFVKIYRVSGTKCAKKLSHTVAVGLFDKEMKMIWHQTIGY